jgi:hypothetical protein
VVSIAMMDLKHTPISLVVALSALALEACSLQAKDTVPAVFSSEG